DPHRRGLAGKRVERRVHRALDRVLDRHDGALDRTVLNRHHRLVDAGVRNLLDAVGRRGAQRLLGEGPRRTEVGDPQDEFDAPAAGSSACSIASSSSGESSSSEWPLRTCFTYTRACSRWRMDETTTPVRRESSRATELDWWPDISPYAS